MYIAKCLSDLMEGGQKPEQWYVENVWRKKSKSQEKKEIVWDVNEGN